MATDSFFSDKKIGIIEPLDKNKNDRTWSFWEEGEGEFDAIVKKRWRALDFFGTKGRIRLDTGDFQYKMIQGIDFYKFCLDAIDRASNITWIKDHIVNIQETDSVTVKGASGDYAADLAFKTFANQGIKLEDHLSVIQHFGGWFVQFEEDKFDPDAATFMDFRIQQGGDTRFFYVLPLNKREALVEIAIFSNEPWVEDQYDLAIQSYIEQHIGLEKFTIKEKEYGRIPMTTYPFWIHDSKHIRHLGTGAGAVKPSSGYAFSRIQKHSDFVINSLKKGGEVPSSKELFKNRFFYYDGALLHVLLKQGKSCAEVFTQMFSRNKGHVVLSFLNEDTHLYQETRLFATMPILPFSRGLLSVII